MHYLVWLARFLVFVLVLLFALNNLTPVDVRLYGEHVFAGVPLVLVMLAAFFLGTVFAVLLVAGTIFRRRREIKRLKRELARVQDDIRYPAGGSATAPETLAPLAPL